MNQATIIYSIISKPTRLILIVLISALYHLISAYLSTHNMNLPFQSRLELYIYVTTYDTTRALMQFIIPILMALYIILETCVSNTKPSRFSLPLATALASGISCIGCTLPIIASLGILSSILVPFLSLAMPLSIIILLYSINKRLELMVVSKRTC
ncbi:MAG: hypothetical protein NZ908_01180 [Candidatus Micrarchaeota archaeon]|nr:hypothetical protein [Candidatus Micrarchaeota archaeon]MCX8154494.1 hypothetical protein [Candidatus Micrarchaeota archaeon]